LHSLDNPGYAANGAALEAYKWSEPLEDLVDARRGPHKIYDLNLRILNEELQKFLSWPQPLPLSIAKKIFAIVSRLRQARMSAVRTDLLACDADAPMFPDMPADTGHFGVPYFDHVLRGLRLSPPPYVEQIASGRQPPAYLRQNLAGLVLIDVL
jgi:hypothetical protein